MPGTRLYNYYPKVPLLFSLSLVSCGFTNMNLRCTYTSAAIFTDRAGTANEIRISPIGQVPSCVVKIL